VLEHWDTSGSQLDFGIQANQASFVELIGQLKKYKKTLQNWQSTYLYGNVQIVSILLLKIVM